MLFQHFYLEAYRVFNTPTVGHCDTTGQFDIAVQLVKLTVKQANHRLEKRNQLMLVYRFLMNSSISFGSTNELIKDMLQMKEGYVAVETELKEMHERYSKLSLDFAEVEGDRQRLVLMLKNVRLSKSVLRRSLTCSHEELAS
ncbi:hypothetical protein RND81_02G072800 [Saponaria officinalis]|uniref:Uncharacterized protein n=1 Tax=Saponaria officinalis TaxID=3572 RepID=A0AAW1MRE9_SAPOF